MDWPADLNPLPALSAAHDGVLGVPCAPQPGPMAVLVLRQDDLLAGAGLAHLGDADLARMTTGAMVPPGWTPFASRYAGHQFGVWAGQLGDGRALTLARVGAAGAGGLDLQIKGAGLTPYSRMGDGRAVLRSSLREMWAGEYLHALGVPTTRCAAVALSGVAVARERTEPGACVLRVAGTFLRPGHFEALAFLDGLDAPAGAAAHAALLELACRQTAPDLLRLEGPVRAQALLRRFAERTGALVGAWMAEGFVHGVMNTDNFAIDGATLDFGPFAFMERFDPDFCPNHTDQGGLYAWRRQGGIVRWNLAVFAQALGPEIGQAHLDDADAAMEAAMMQGWEARLGRKLGFAANPPRALIQAAFTALQESGWDYTHFFTALLDSWSGAAVPAPLAAFHAEWRSALAAANIGPEQAKETQARAVPRWVPRLALLAEAIQQTEAGDLSAARSILDLCRDPFLATEAGRTAQARWQHLDGPPPPGAARCELSCSS